MAELSVLMSLYIKEKPEYAKACFDSLLNQTVKADEWVIVEDGPLSKEMYDLLAEYENANPGLIKRIPFEKNQGLGLALRAGVPDLRLPLRRHWLHGLEARGYQYLGDARDHALCRGLHRH